MENPQILIYDKKISVLKEMLPILEQSVQTGRPLLIIAEDILASGESLLDIATELRRRKARRVFPCVSFTLFTEGLAAYQKAYEEGLFDLLLGTNLAHLDPELKQKPWFCEVNMSKYVALLIATLNHDASISGLLDPHERIERLLEEHRKGGLP